MDAFLQELAADELRIVKTALYPSRWRDFNQQYSLIWKSLDFNDSNKNTVPSEKGIYCFHVGHDFPGLPPISVALYGGEAVDLNRRSQDYLREKDRIDGRKTVRKFLKIFEGEIMFRYALVDIEGSLRPIEAALNDALMPPYSRRDFSAEVRAGRNAWQ